MDISKGLTFEEAFYRENISLVTRILLRGFENLQGFRLVLVSLILIMFFVTICGNILILTLVTFSKNLHHPMYIFLSQLSISDMLLTMVIVPNMLRVILKNGVTLTLASCIAQFYFFGASESSESLLLTVMSYDRYLAICSPLHYSTIMDNSLCLKSIVMSWSMSLSLMFVTTIAISRVHFCDHNIIDHFFCDLSPLLKLSCSDTKVVELEASFLSIPVLICPFIIILISYIFIVITILGISSISGRKKAFSTCSSHLTVVCTFYLTLISIYVVPTRGHSLTISKALSLLYTVFTPLLNPIVYSLRNNDIKDAFKKCFWKKKLSYVMQ